MMNTDDRTDDDDVSVYRARAKTMLDEIAGRAKQALTEQDIDTPLFFLIPNSGSGVLIFGTPDDPADDQWNRIRGIVAPLVAESVGLDRVRCREVMCATTSDKWIGGHGPVPMHAPAVNTQEPRNEIP